MKTNISKIEELAESWINGNISHVKEKVFNLNKLEFTMLCIEISKYNLVHGDAVCNVNALIATASALTRGK